MEPLRALVLLGLFAFSSGTPIQSSIHGSADISFDGRSILDWEVNSPHIIFQVTVATTGYVGFGISPNGGMDGSDIVLGGVNADGTAYLADRFGVGYDVPVVDFKQDWYLVGALENSTHTQLKFYRLLDTGDVGQDSPILNGQTGLIWAIGDTDDTEYHFRNRGFTTLNLLE